MSQAGINGNGSIAAIFTITTDSGTATPTGGNVNLYGDTTVSNGASVLFRATGSTITLQLTDADGNTLIGDLCGNASITGLANTGLGDLCLRALTSGNGSTAVGVLSLNKLTSGSTNVALGGSSLANLVSGGHNVCLGSLTGLSYTTNEDSNILIGHDVEGTIGESNTLRIGDGTGSGQGQLNRAFIQGIVGVTTSNSQGVTIDTTTGQLGAFPFYGSMSVTHITNADSPYTVLATDVCILADSTLGPITVLLPNAPFEGRVFFIKDVAGAAAANAITVTTVGGVRDIDAATTFVMNTNYQSIQVVFSLFSGGQYSII